MERSEGPRCRLASPFAPLGVPPRLINLFSRGPHVSSPLSVVWANRPAIPTISH